jgi:hypothetical protein
MRPSSAVLLLAALLTGPIVSRAAGRHASERAPAAEPAPAEKTEAAPAQARGPQRVDFDDRLLQGQSNRLGAVYLYQRKEPAQPSLLDRHKSFRAEIRRDLLE